MLKAIGCITGLFLLVSCGTSETKPPIPNTQQCSYDPELYPYFTDFINEAAEHGITIKYNSVCAISFVESFPDHPVGIVGLCSMLQYKGTSEPVHGTEKIEIWKDWWDNASDLKRKAVMLHELAHCSDLHKEHVPQKNHLMSAAIPQEEIIEQNWDVWMDELFQK